jgi:hypothetical protein
MKVCLTTLKQCVATGRSMHGIFQHKFSTPLRVILQSASMAM